LGTRIHSASGEMNNCRYCTATTYHPITRDLNEHEV
jgi:hypothetical protein